MKKLRHNTRIIAVIILAMFIGLGGYFSYSVYFYGGRWAANVYNPRLREQKQLVAAGDILDRKGDILATTVNGSRTYPSGENTRRAISHVVGDSGGVVGNGVETFMSSYLLGFKANVWDRVTQLFSGASQRGDDVRLTIDAELCQYAASLLKRFEAGAVVVLNYRTGEVLCSTSFPDFDPRNIAQTMQNTVDNGALVNRVTQGTYPPGSTFKIITMASALENIPDVSGRGFQCTGTLLVDWSTLTEANNQVHGVVTMKQAFAQSCNTTFGALSLELGYNKLSKTASAFGFGDDFSFRDMVVYNSQYPTTNQSRDDLAWSGVGQGRVLVTPLHMAMIAGAIGNNGVMMEPRLLIAATSARGASRGMRPSRTYKLACSQETAKMIQEFMLSTVESGTGTQAKISGYRVAGKTGSAESSNDKTIMTHAWFAGFLLESEHPLAIAVVIERGGGGGSVAAPIAQKVLTKALGLGY